MRIMVRDKHGLANACRQIERWEGSARDNDEHESLPPWKRAAWRLGIGKGTFWRLRKAEGGPTLNQSVFRAISRYHPPDHASVRAVRDWERTLEEALITPDGVASILTYIRWLNAQLRRYGLVGGREAGGWASPRGRPTIARECWRVLRELRKRYPAEFGPLRKLEDTRRPKRELNLAGTVDHIPLPGCSIPGKHTIRQCRADRNYWESREETWWTDKWRFELAYLRIVEPLVVAGRAGGVELTWEEMADPRPVQGRKGSLLQAYLATAVQRECLLLKRDGDLQRAQRLIP
jgi:hypothetical protein